MRLSAYRQTSAEPFPVAWFETTSIGSPSIVHISSDVMPGAGSVAPVCGLAAIGSRGATYGAIGGAVIAAAAFVKTMPPIWLRDSYWQGKF